MPRLGIHIHNLRKKNLAHTTHVETSAKQFVTERCTELQQQEQGVVSLHDPKSRFAGLTTTMSFRQLGDKVCLKKKKRKLWDIDSYLHKTLLVKPIYFNRT